MSVDERPPELTIVQADNLEWLRGTPPASFELCYVDPPFNTGRERELVRLRTRSVPGDAAGGAGDRTGFGGRRYATEAVGRRAYPDRFDDYLEFLVPRLEEAWRVLTDAGSLFVHLDPRESHHVKVALDERLGRARFMNEIVWSYDYGARSKSRWSAKHDVILWYAKDPRRATFLYDEIDRIPYMAPALVGAEKAARGKTPTDVWWNTIVSPTGKERTGYPTQKPLAILERIVRVHSRPGERVLDCFAGSGTTGEAAIHNGRSCVLVDRGDDAIEVMRRRLAFAHPRFVAAPRAPGASTG